MTIKITNDLTQIDYPRYDSYKETSEEWIGKIPTTWDSVPLRNIFKFRNEKNDPIITDEILSLSIAHGVTKYSDKNRGGNKRKDDITAYKIARPNDIVLNSMNIIVGAVGLSKYFGAISPVYYALYLHSNEANINYYEWVFHNESFQKSLLKYGKGILIKMGEGGKMNTIRMKISQHDMKYFILPCPPLSDQEKIAKFLVKKTTQIDQAITLKQQQIAKLEEYKQIIIQNAVTKGLNPDAPMKDSGVDWIGNIPEHWEVKKLKYIVKIRKRIIGYEGVDILSITQKGVKVKDITSGEGQLAMDYSKYQIVHIGDFAMNHMDLLTGYIDISKFEGVVSPDYRVFTNEFKGVLDSYLLSILQMGYKQKILFKYGQGVSMLGRWRLPATNFNNFLIPIPSMGEQKQIVQFINDLSVSTNKAIDIYNQNIDRLKEYKTILINQAVTGKIKVS